MDAPQPSNADANVYDSGDWTYAEGLAHIKSECRLPVLVDMEPY